MQIWAQAATVSMFGLLLMAAQAQAEDSVGTISDGLVLHRTTAGDGQRAVYLRVNPDKFDVRVLTALAPLSDYKTAKIRSLERAPRGFFLRDYLRISSAAAVLSGGYLASFSPPEPLGFIKSNNVLANSVHDSWLTEGVFCSGVGQAQIERMRAPDDYAEYRDCLQAGPLLLIEGKPPFDAPSAQAHGYGKLKSSMQEQAFICTTADNRVVLGVTGKIDIPALVEFLGRDEVGCVDAIRLTGHKTAGITLGTETFGYDEYLFPSVIAVIARQ